MASCKVERPRRQPATVRLLYSVGLVSTKYLLRHRRKLKTVQVPKVREGPLVPYNSGVPMEAISPTSSVTHHTAVYHVCEKLALVDCMTTGGNLRMDHTEPNRHGDTEQRRALPAPLEKK